MRTVRLLYPNLASKKPGLKLAIRDAEQLRHLQVLKAGKDNYKYQLGDGLGNIATAELLQLVKDGALFRLKEFVERSQLQLDKKTIGTKFSILVPLIRQPLLEQAVAQVTQLNLFHEVQLYFSDFTRYSSKEFSANKLLRLNKIAASSYSQSKSSYKPQVFLNGSMFEALQHTLGEDDLDTALVIAPTLSSQRFQSSELSAVANKSEFKHVVLVIGAEGGFSESESKLLSGLPSHYLATLGNSVYTSETAATVFSGLLVSIFQ